jgi:thioesterase domain-containing protein
MALRPRRVLEIGVGSGLLLSQIAPVCVEYWGTDFSAPTIQTLHAAVAAQSWGDRVRLRVQPADVADGLPERRFDAVVLNSVVQYFPSVSYLRDVLAMAMRMLAPGGAVFIGDVRNNSLQGAFQTGVALARTTTDSADAAEIHQRVHRAVLSEPELLLAPEFFTTWAAEQPSVAGLDIQVKRGSADNELTRYRYDVTIHTTPTSVRSLATAPTHTWTQCAGVNGLHDQLTSERPAEVRITDVPRAGLITDVSIEEAMAAGLPLADAVAQSTPDAVTPEDLHRLGDATGYHVAVTWGAAPGTLDAVFTAATDVGHVSALTDLYLPPTGTRRRGTHANNPHTNTKISAVRQRLSTRLPDYMVPAQIIVLDEFPLTSSGKIDRKALPAPVFAARAFRVPQTHTDKIVAGVFADVLGVDRVGLDDSFFDLGGDSLSAMRVIAAINTSMDTHLPVRILFEAPSVSGLSQKLSTPVSPIEIAPVETLKQGSGIPLFCFHPAGGLAWPYQPLGNYVDCPIIGIQQAQDQVAEPESIRHMARNYADRLQAVHPRGPYNLLGWSLGGVIAHEVAIELSRRGCAVGRLVLLDAAPWGDVSLPRDLVLGNAVESYVLELMLGYLRIEIPEQLKPLTYERAEELLQDQFALPAAQLRTFLEFFVKNMRASFLYISQHVPRVFDGDMVIFYATRNVGDWHLPLHWRPYITGAINEHPVDCAHLEMLTPESLMMYGEQLKLSLRQVQ